MYLTKKILRIDSDWALNAELQITALNIDAVTKTITIYYQVAIVSPNGSIVTVLETGTATRTNLECNPKWDQLEASPIGQGIKQMLQPDLDAWPNMLQANNC